MKKKKYLIVSSVVIICILILVFSIVFVNSKRSINKLISQLENAINKHDIEKIIDLYPDYCKTDVKKYFSQEKLNEFYNKIIMQDNKDIKINILDITNYDTSYCNEIMEEINNDYQKNIEIDDCQLVSIKYHDDFSESVLQVIKIGRKYYLYHYGYINEPLCYFH